METEETLPVSEMPHGEQDCGRKLLEGERVEVRMKEKGLRGSWHPAVVCKVLNGKRHVQFEELCINDGSPLKETVRVGRGVDGVGNSPAVQARLRKKATLGAEDRRLSIRPIPPPINIPFNKWQAGTAVESFYNDAWWEGYLVTDAPEDKDASVKVVYPDEPQSGAEPVPLNKLRLGQEWNEETGNWMLKAQASREQLNHITGVVGHIKAESGGGSLGNDNHNLTSKPSSACAESSRSSKLSHEQCELELRSTQVGHKSGKVGEEGGRFNLDTHGMQNPVKVGELKKKRGRPRKNPCSPVEANEMVEKSRHDSGSYRSGSGTKNGYHCPETDALVSHEDGTRVQRSKEESKRALNGRSVAHSTEKELAEKETPGGAADASQTQLCKRGRGKKVCSGEEGKEVLCSTKQKLLCRMIDAGILEEGTPVTYTTDKHSLKGVALRDGVRCGCCEQVLSMSAFEAHAKSSLKRPSANIYLDDGRSLQEVLRDAASTFKSRQETGNAKDVPEEEIDYSDDLCRLCGDGGDLICCESCPVTFHLECIGLKSVPDDDWFCPACRCAICGGSDFDPEFSEKTVVLCDQCEREYHVGCMNKEGMPLMDSLPEGNWFCSRQCELISEELRSLVGRQLPLEDGFSWTLLQCPEGPPTEDSLLQLGNHSNINEALKLLPAKQAKKMRLGLKVMHECFNPILDPRTQEDLIPSIVNNRRTRYADFSRFYTALLERDDELITVATIRVFGSYLAEMPLIGTRFDYRRQGMCRRLMNAVEELLANLGVVRLVLPAVAEVKDTWRGGFGFQDIPDTQKRRLAEVGILVFPGTTTLQKPIALPSPEVHADRKQLRSLRGRVLAACNHPCAAKSNLPSFDPIVPEGFSKLDGGLPGMSLLPGASCRSFQLGSPAEEQAAMLASGENTFEMRHALKDVVSFQAEVGNLPTAALGMPASVRVRSDGIVVDLEGMRLPATCWLAAAAKLKRKVQKQGQKLRRKEREDVSLVQQLLPGAKAILKDGGQTVAIADVGLTNDPLIAGEVDGKDEEASDAKTDRQSSEGSEERVPTLSGTKRKSDEAVSSSPEDSKRVLSGRTRSRQVKMPERFRDSNMEVTMGWSKMKTSEEFALENGVGPKDDFGVLRKLHLQEAAIGATSMLTMRVLSPECAACRQMGHSSPECLHKFQGTPQSAPPVLGGHEAAARKRGSDCLGSNDNEHSIMREMHGHSARARWEADELGAEPRQQQVDWEEGMQKKRRIMVGEFEGHAVEMPPPTFPEGANEAKRRKMEETERRRHQFWPNCGFDGGGASKGLRLPDSPGMVVKAMVEQHRSNLPASSMLHGNFSPKAGQGVAAPVRNSWGTLLPDFRRSHGPSQLSFGNAGSTQSCEGQGRGSFGPNGSLDGARGQASAAAGVPGKDLHGQRERKHELERPGEEAVGPGWMPRQQRLGHRHHGDHVRAADVARPGSIVSDLPKLPGSRGMLLTGFGKGSARVGEEMENPRHTLGVGVSAVGDNAWGIRSQHTSAASASEPGTSFRTANTTGFRATLYSAVNGSGGAVQGKGQVQPLSRPPPSDQRPNFEGVNSIRHGALPGIWAKRGLKIDPHQPRGSPCLDIARACAVPLKLSKASAVGKARAVERQSCLMSSFAVGTSAGAQQGLAKNSFVSPPADAMTGVASRICTSGAPTLVPTCNQSLPGKVGNAGFTGFAPGENGGSFLRQDVHGSGIVLSDVGLVHSNGRMGADSFRTQADPGDKGKRTAFTGAGGSSEKSRLLSVGGNGNTDTGNGFFASAQRASCHLSSDMPEPEARVSSSAGVAFRNVVVPEQVK